MLASPQPSSSQLGRNSPVGVARQPKRPTASRDGLSVSTTEKQPLWIPMLQSASKGKDLTEKQLIILGGTPDLQREFLDQLHPDVSSRQNLRSNDRRKQRQNVPVSNKFALGYTYHDVLDADQEDILARLNIHLLTNPSGQLSSLLRPLLTSKTVKDTLITILLDWTDPFLWARQLRQWIRLLRKVILALDEETKLSMEENMNAWKERRMGPDVQSSTQQEVLAPLGPGEWDEGLGIPLSVVCVQGERIERLERELGWGEDQFDFLQQWLRTVLLKHGGSLIYTASFDPNNVRTLIHTSLNIQSLLKRETAKHNFMDRDKILIPPNWDSWAKIRILKDRFDPEPVSNAWSVEIQEPPEDNFDLATPNTKPETEAEILAQHTAANSSTSAVTEYERSLPPPIEDTTTQQSPSTTEITVVATPFQEFLQSQFGILEKLKAEDAADLDQRMKRVTGPVPLVDSGENSTTGSGAISPVKGSVNPSSFLTDSIGSHRVNVNGIDLDAEEATRKLRERENERNALRRGPSENVVPGAAAAAATTAGATAVPSGTQSPVKPNISRGVTSDGNVTPGAAADGKPRNEELHGFFANLIKKGEQGRNRGSAMGSGTASPRRESPAPPGQRREE